MKYFIDKNKVKKRVMELGYKNLAQFAVKNKIHRNTLRQILSGKNVFLSSFEKIASRLKLDPMELILPWSVFPSKIKEIDEIRPIVARLVREVPKGAVVLLGSRAALSPKKYSDWDLGLLKYPEPLSGTEYLKLKGWVEEWSEDLVRQVDLINLNQAPSWFLEGINNQITYLDGNWEAFVYLRGLLDGIEKEKAA